MPESLFQSISMTYGGICLIVSGAYYLGQYNNCHIALLYEHVLTRFQAWRLITNFFFIGHFSWEFSFRLVLILKFGGSLERGPFDNRRVDYLRMLIFGALLLLVMAAIPSLWSSFMGDSLVFMVVYVWGRMFPNEPVHILRLGEVKGLYIPWCALGLDYLLGKPVTQDILGIIVGHVYYFFAVLHPLAGGKNIFTAPLQIQLSCSLSLLVIAICVAHTYPAEIYAKYGRGLCGIPCPSNRL